MTIHWLMFHMYHIPCARACVRVRARTYLFIYLIIIVKLCKVLYRSACNLQTIRTCILYEK